MLYYYITDTSKTSELKITSIRYFLCGLIDGSTSCGIGWASGIAGDSKLPSLQDWQFMLAPGWELR